MGKVLSAAKWSFELLGQRITAFVLKELFRIKDLQRLGL
jgi:hypothetical protein